MFFTFSLLLICFSSCTVSKPVSYFRNLTNDTLLTVAPRIGEDLKIKAGDKLSLSFSSLNPDEDRLYNLAGNQYEVSSEGNIYLHRLGKLPVQGLTRKQAKQKIEEGMQPYLKDPIVTISFTNHYVTLMGDVSQSKVIPMPEERISVLDVLAQGGIVSSPILLSDIIIIRDSSETQKKIKHINLEGHTAFNSDYFYLQPNDVVVVKPDEKAITDEKKRLKIQQISSMTLQAVTLGLVIYQTFFRNR